MGAERGNIYMSNSVTGPLGGGRYNNIESDIGSTISLKCRHYIKCKVHEAYQFSWKKTTQPITKVGIHFLCACCFGPFLRELNPTHTCTFMYSYAQVWDKYRTITSAKKQNKSNIFPAECKSIVRYSTTHRVSMCPSVPRTASAYPFYPRITDRPLFTFHCWNLDNKLYAYPIKYGMTIV